MMTEIKREFAYRPSVSSLLKTMLVSGTSALALFYFAVTNRVGLDLNGMIRVSSTGATVFYSILALVSSAMTLSALISWLRRTQTTNQLTITMDAIVLPVSRWSSRIQTIPFTSITKMTPLRIQNRFVLQLRKDDGKRINIFSDYLPSHHVFDEVCAFVRHRTHNVAN
ncbi:MAG: hypothetical protein R3C28_10195 [Pirellulaceae bacterium]